MIGWFYNKYLWLIIVIGLFTTYFLLMLDGQYGWIPLLFWLLSCLLVAAYKRRSLRLKFSFNKPDKVTVIAGGFIGILYLLKIIFLLSNPEKLFVHHDEAMLGKYALEAIILGIHYDQWSFLGSFSGTVTRFPAIWYYMTGGLIYMLGPSFFSVKLLAILTDFTISICIFVLIRRWFGQLLGIMATIIYGSLPAVIHFSMTGYQNLQSTLGLMITWLLLDRSFSQQTGNKEIRWYIFCAGLVSGLSMYFYLSSVLIPALAVLWIVLFARRNAMLLNVSLREYILGFLMTSIPFWIYSFTEFNFLTGRSEAIIFSPDARFWMTQLYKTLGGLYFGHANGSGLFYIYAPFIPSLYAFLLFVVGVIGGFWKKIYGAKTIILLSVLLLTLVFGGVFTNQPPASQRLLHILPIIALFMTIAIHMIGMLFKGYVRSVVIIFLGCLLVFSNMYIFRTENLFYYKERVVFEQSFVTWYESHADQDLPVFGTLPVHMFDMIFFYSNGSIIIKPLLTDQEITQTQEVAERYLYVTTPDDQQWLESIVADHQKTELLHTFTNGYELYLIEKS